MDKTEQKELIDFIVKTLKDSKDLAIKRDNLEGIIADEFYQNGECREKFDQKVYQVIEDGKNFKLITEKDDKIMLLIPDCENVLRKNNSEDKDERTYSRPPEYIYYISSDDDEDEEEPCDRPPKRKSARFAIINPEEKTRRRRPRRSRSRRPKRSRSRRRR